MAKKQSKVTDPVADKISQSFEIEDVFKEKIKNLERKKQSLENDIESLTKKVCKIQSDCDKEIAKKLQDHDAYVQSTKRELSALDREIKKGQADIKKAKEEKETLQEEAKKLQEQRTAVSIEQKEVAKAKTLYLEKTRESELLIEQFNERIKELDKKNKK